MSSGGIGGGGLPGLLAGPLYLGCGDPANNKILQHALNGASLLTTLREDGIFGAGTDAAVRNFQKSKGLAVDGIVGPKTAAALNLMYVSRAPLPTPPKPRPSGGGGKPLPVNPHGNDSTAMGDMVEAILHGLNSVHNGILSALRSMSGDLADVVEGIVSAVSGRFSIVAATIRGAAAGATAAQAQSVGAIIGSAIRGYLGSIQQAIPDILGLDGIFAKIRAIILKIQVAVNRVIDLVIRTFTGAAGSVFDAISEILGTFAGVASLAT